MELPTPVALIWSLTLVVAIVVIIPVTVRLLHRALNAARRIDFYTARALEAGLGVAANTANVAALRETVSLGAAAVDVTGSIEAHTATIEQVMTTRGRE